MFEVFTPRALNVVALADSEAREIGWTYIGSEHLLLGMLGGGEGTAARTLRSAGVDLQSVRVEMLRHISTAAGRTQGRVWLDFTPRAREILEAAACEAEQRGDQTISTGHLLLGMTAVGDGLAVRILRELGVQFAGLRLETQELLSKEEKE